MNNIAPFPRLFNRLKKKRKHVLILYGPRKTGKTQLAFLLQKQVDCPVHYARLKPQDDSRETWIFQQWNLARQKLKQKDSKTLLLILDDIHKIPLWAACVKQCWDEDSRRKNRIKVLLIGTEHKLEKAANDRDFPLQNLAKWYARPLWTYPELKQIHDLSPLEYAWFGSYPGTAGKRGKEGPWKRAYLQEVVQPALTEDVFLNHRIDKPSLFQRFLHKGAVHSGMVVSYTHFLKEFPEAGNTTTLARYLETLNQCRILAGIPKFDPEGKRKRASSPKFLPYDTGLPHAFAEQTLKSTLKDREKLDQALRTAIGSHLLKFSGQDSYELFYWKERQFEVDFVLVSKGKTLLVELEKGTWRQDAGLKAFYKKFDLDKVVLIGHEGISWEEFLEIDPNSLF